MPLLRLALRLLPPHRASCSLHRAARMAVIGLLLYPSLSSWEPHLNHVYKIVRGFDLLSLSAFLARIIDVQSLFANLAAKGIPPSPPPLHVQTSSKGGPLQGLSKRCASCDLGEPTRLRPDKQHAPRCLPDAHLPNNFNGQCGDGQHHHGSGSPDKERLHGEEH